MDVVDKVAIILPTYNSKSTIDRAINSVLLQSFKYWTLYIIDDSSTDGTLEYIINNYKDERIKVLKNNENLGVARARNVGISCAKESILAFIDSDDEWSSYKLEVQMKYLDANCIVASWYNYIRSDNKSIKICYSKSQLTKGNFLKKNFRVCFSSIMIKNTKKILFKNIGHEDFLYIFDNLSENDGIVIVDQPLVNYYEQSSSLSANKINAAKWHYNCLKKITDKKGLILFFYLSYVINAILFSLKTRVGKWKKLQ